MQSHLRMQLLVPGVALVCFGAWTLGLAIPAAGLFLATLWPVPVVVLLAATIVGLCRYRWSVRWSILTSVAGLWFLVAYPSLFGSAASTLSRWVDFAYYRGDLDALVRQRRKTSAGPALAALAIGGFGSIAYGIAYDESGEITLPAGHQSPRWQAAAKYGELDRDEWDAMRLSGNYFWWTAQ